MKKVMLSALQRLFKGNKKLPRGRGLVDLRQEVLNRTGREQFEKIMKKGLSIPVVML